MSGLIEWKEDDSGRKELVIGSAGSLAVLGTTVVALAFGANAYITTVMGGTAPNAPTQPPAGGAGTEIFRCDWPTTGTTTAANIDCGAVDWVRFNPNAFEIAADTFDFPTTNALYMTDDDNSEWVGFDPRDGVINDTITTNDVRSWRYYIRIVKDTDYNALDTNEHGLYDAVATDAPPATTTTATWFQDQNLSTEIWHDAGQRAVWQIGMRFAENCITNCRFFSPNLNADQTYRVEWQVDMASATTFQLDARIYDINDVLLFGPGDFDAEVGVETLANESVMTVNNEAAAFSSYWVGTTGFDVPASELYLVIGAVSICDDDWCGAWTAP